MITYSLDTTHFIGFAAEKSEPGKKVKIITKCKLMTSDKPVFHVWMRHITGIFLQQSPVLVTSISKFLILIHSNDKADVYINDFEETSLAKVTRNIKAGEQVYVSDISDISDIKFPDIDVKPDDCIIYCCRNEWRFSLYFDAERQIDTDVLAQELGELKKEGVFYSLLESTNAQVSMLDPHTVKVIVLTEGKTDWKHLLAAMNKLNIKTDIAFFEDDKDRGADDLLKMCEHYSELPQSIPMIFVFDRDDKRIMSKLKAKEQDDCGYQEWGHNVFSMCLPVPKDRSDETHAISIEFFYKDKEITQMNSEGRRIFFSTEFHKKTGNHISHPLHCAERNKIDEHKIGIIDSAVYDRDNHSFALSKNDFAEAVLNQQDNYTNFDFTEFNAIFNIIEQIINLRISH
ncbi:MAG: hypothetical protein EHM58_01275 [Ignavibacteriae bacterium]|nr:MAG: hypothetical protein EHM58_01275 [Ignavibacteriota bacterium]